jgi:hypothetical protein
MKIVVVCGVLVAGCSSSSNAGAAFAGTWNYDQPDRSTGKNIAKVICPSPRPSLVVPQIGNIVISEVGDDAIQGTTDQGCTWRFAVDGDAATLSPRSQTCFNQVIGSSYTLDWSMHVSGDHETEVITGTSHLPAGDCEFELNVSSRTRVDPISTVDPATAFVGNWSYDAPDQVTGVNIEQVICGSQVDYTPVLGSFAVTRSADGRLAVTSDQGCAWTFSVAGNTAELNPANQSCAGTQSTMGFWAMASDGQHGAVFASGLSHQSGGDCAFLISAGSLTKQ